MPDSAPSPRRVMAVLFLGTLMAALDIALVAPGLSAIAAGFDLDTGAASWVLSVFVLANLVGLPLMTSLADRHGRRRLFVACAALFGAGALVVMLAPNYGVMLGGRGLQGLGASGLFPMASAVVGETVAPERRGRALGLLGAVFGLAFLIGPVVGGILLGVVGWRALFAVSLGLAVAVSALGWAWLPASERGRAGAPDWAGMFCLAAALGALAWGLSGLDAERLAGSLLAPVVALPLLAGAALLGAFAWTERRVAAPFLRMGLLASGPVRTACLLAFGAGLVEALFVFLSTFSVEAFGVSRSAASFMLLPLVAAVAVGAPIGGRLLDKVGARPIVASGSLLLTLGLAMWAWAGSSGLVGYYGGSLLVGFGLAGLLGAPLSYLMLREAGVGERTVAQGLLTVFISIGQLIGSAIVGALVATGATPLVGFRAAFLATASVGVVLVVASVRLDRRAVAAAGA